MFRTTASKDINKQQDMSSQAVIQKVIQPLTKEEKDFSASMEPYKVLDITTGKVEEVSVRDYVIGAVCAEMPATFKRRSLESTGCCLPYLC